jgi:DNA-binding LytR/AlgR family response regulator
MKVLIFEDEAPAARKIVKLIHEYDSTIEVLEVIESVKDALTWFGENELPNLIFSDIQLADSLSFQVFKEIDLKVPVIFTTAYNEYAIEAFNHYSIDYLLKPVKLDDLARSVNKFKDYKGFQSERPDFEAMMDRLTGRDFRNRFLVSYRDGLIPIDIKDIAYFYSQDSVTFLKHNNKRSYIINETLDALEKQLDPKKFFRANRQTIISDQCIEKVEPYFNQKLVVHIFPEPDETVTISKLKATAFKDWLNS